MHNKEIFNNPPPFDNNAFNALLLYEKKCRFYEYGIPEHLHYCLVKYPKGLMQDCANKFGTTIKEMKKHWRDVDYILDNNLDNKIEWI